MTYGEICETRKSGLAFRGSKDLVRNPVTDLHLYNKRTIRPCAPFFNEFTIMQQLRSPAPLSNYSLRRASTGFTDAARRAGT